MTRVLILDNFAEKYVHSLAGDFPQVRFTATRTLAALPADVSGFDALVAFGIAVNDDLMMRASGLKWIQSLATGVDHFLKSPGLRQETILTSARGIHGPAMSETVAHLMLAIARETRKVVENQQNRLWERRVWSLLHGKTALVCGVGLSSTAIAKLLKAFGMIVIGASRTPRDVDGFDEIVATDELARHVGRADYLVNVLPAAPQNQKLLNAEVFSAMKRDARFINVGRGETVDENALIAALSRGDFAGAALDVFAVEPLPPESPLWNMPNVMITPHVAGFFDQYEDFILPLIRRNMKLFLEGRWSDMENIVDH
jgi:D-2-hydroxyacid dehydrogenase (NADP+)